MFLSTPPFASFIRYSKSEFITLHIQRIERWMTNEKAKQGKAGENTFHHVIIDASSEYLLTFHLE